MITADEYCKANKLDSDKAFLVRAAVDYDKHRDDEEWRANALISRYDKEIFATIDRMEACAKTEAFSSDESAVPAHYKGKKYEVIELIEDQNLGFSAGSICKYLSRYGLKDSELSEIRKVRYYFNVIINRVIKLAREEK